MSGSRSRYSSAEFLQRGYSDSSLNDDSISESEACAELRVFPSSSASPHSPPSSSVSCSQLSHSQSGSADASPSRKSNDYAQAGGKFRVTSAPRLRRLSIRSTCIDHVVVAPPHLEILFNTAENIAHRSYAEFFQNYSVGSFETKEKDRYVLVPTRALSVDLLSYLTTEFPPMNEGDLIALFHNILYTLGLGMGHNDLCEVRNKFPDLSPLMLVTVVPVIQSYKGWGSCHINTASQLTASGANFAFVWEQKFSAEAYAWKQTGVTPPHHCVCSMTCGYYAGWVSEAIGFKVNPSSSFSLALSLLPPAPLPSLSLSLSLTPSFSVHDIIYPR